MTHGEPALPGHAGHEHDAQLHHVDDHHAYRPGANARKRPAWDDAFEQQAAAGDHQNRLEHTAMIFRLARRRDPCAASATHAASF